MKTTYYDNLEQIGLYDLDTDLDSVIALLQEKKAKYSGKYNRLMLSLENVPYEDYQALYLKGEREMTEDELNKATKKEKEDLNLRIQMCENELKALKALK